MKKKKKVLKDRITINDKKFMLLHMMNQIFYHAQLLLEDEKHEKKKFSPVGIVLFSMLELADYYANFEGIEETIHLFSKNLTEVGNAKKKKETDKRKS